MIASQLAFQYTDARRVWQLDGEEFLFWEFDSTVAAFLRIWDK